MSNEYRVQLSDKESKQGNQLYDVVFKRKIVWTGTAKSLIMYLAKVLKSKTNARNFINYVEKNGYGLIKLDKLNLKKEGKMRPVLKKLLAKKGYDPIFQAIDQSKRQFKQMKYSRGEIQDTLIDMFGDEDPKILQKIKEGKQRDLNNLALYIIDLNTMLSNAKVLAKKDSQYKKYIKFIEKDIKDAEKDLEKLKGESIQEGKWKGTEDELHDYLLYIKKYKPELFSNVKQNRDIKKLLKKFESVNERMGMDPDKARLSMLKIYGSSMVQNFKTILSKLDRGKAIKREWKAFKGIVDLIEKKVEEVL